MAHRTAFSGGGIVGGGSRRPRKARPSNPTYRQFAFGPYTRNSPHQRPNRLYACNPQRNAGPNGDTFGTAGKVERTQLLSQHETERRAAHPACPIFVSGVALATGFSVVLISHPGLFPPTVWASNLML